MFDDPLICVLHHISTDSDYLNGKLFVSQPENNPPGLQNSIIKSDHGLMVLKISIFNFNFVR